MVVDGTDVDLMAVKRRRANGEGTVYRGTDGRWRAAYSDFNGRRKFVSASTRDEVARKLRERLADADRGISASDQRATLEQYALRWLAQTRNTVRPRTAELDDWLVKRYLLPPLGRIPMVRLTPEHVEALMAEQLALGKAPQTVVHIRAILRRILNTAQRHGHVHRNVAALARPPKIERPEIRVLDEDEAVRLLAAAAEDDRFGPLIALALTTGLRQGEALGLRWVDVDLEGRRLHVCGEMQRVRVNLGESGRAKHELRRLDYAKTASSRRTLSLAAEAVDALSHQLSVQRRARLQAGPGWEDAGLVFTTRIGTPVDGTNALAGLHRLLERSRLPRMRFHDLRHTWASLSLRAGVQLWVVSKMLGHSSIALTANTYGHLLPASERDAADRFSALLATGRV